MSSAFGIDAGFGKPICDYQYVLRNAKVAGSRTILDYFLSRTRPSSGTYQGSEPAAFKAQDDGQYEDIWDFVRHATMTSRQRVVALCDAVHYIVDAGIGGDFVECGVWRGGSIMAAAKTLIDRGSIDRRLWLYDTFDGMNAPCEKDVDYLGNSATALLDAHDPLQADSVWCRATLHEVQQNIGSTGYPQEQVEYIIGQVEQTLAHELNRPQKIALLRLDTDWYESTRVALQQLYPRLQLGGVLIVDDYGHWKGCQQAVDEYFAARGDKLLFNRIDYTGRIAVKCTNHRDEARPC